MSIIRNSSRRSLLYSKTGKFRELENNAITRPTVFAKILQIFLIRKEQNHILRGHVGQVILN